MSLNPRAAFEHFTAHLGRFTSPNDIDVEDQFFDRKEIPIPPAGTNVSSGTLKDLREQIRETVSAFANTNAEGGLLILGIAKTGEVRGVDHLTDSQRNSLTNIGQLLRNHSALVRLEACIDHTGGANHLLLIFVPTTPDAICETPEAMPRAWKRAGAQNLLLTDRDRDQLRRDKRIEAFERRLAAPFDLADIDRGLLGEIRTTWPDVTGVDRNDEDLLHELGAIERTPHGFAFTNAGLLFLRVQPPTGHSCGSYQDSPIRDEP